jgi:AraC family transcriptional regulator of adaptative response/methylated-DNA-[protein]-cysteine methyltransferase
MMDVQTYITKNRAEVKGTLSYSVVSKPYGKVLVGQIDNGVCWLGFDLDPETLKGRFPSVHLQEGPQSPDFSHLCLYGTAFQISVWERLLKIKAGETVSYADIARDIGKPKAVRAVGSAVGMNPVSVIIPCHRVLPKSGGVGNYLWGAEKKAALLQSESAVLPLAG